MTSDWRPKIYLCGTITADPKYIHWRTLLPAALPDVEFLNPLRGKSTFSQDGLQQAEDAPYSEAGFVTRDLQDIDAADAVLLRMQDIPQRQSIGTWFEFGYAHGLGIPVVVVATDYTIVDHPFVKRFATEVFSTLDEAAAYFRFLFG